MGKIITVHINISGIQKPVNALSLRQGLYKILPTLGDNSDTNNWEFPPGTVVRISEQSKDGKPIFTARSKNQ